MRGWLLALPLLLAAPAAWANEAAYHRQPAAAAATTSTASAAEADEAESTTPQTSAGTQPADGTDSTEPKKTENEQLTDQLNSLLKAKSDQQALSEAVAISNLLGCASKVAGEQNTQNFYSQMQGVGKQIADLCQKNRADDARLLALSTMKSIHYNQVVMAINNCYDMNRANFESMAGPELSSDAAKYNRWIRYPYTAQREMTAGDVCK